jgi:putative transposase
MARGVDGRQIFADDSDRRLFLATAGRLTKGSSGTILAYCLMGNHFHFALRVGSVPLSRIMHRLLTTYVMAFNFRHDRDGHLFQARYKSVLCLDDAYLLGLIRYIHMNPVRAGLVAAPHDWPWSSHRMYAKGNSAGNADFNPWPEPLPSSPLLRAEEMDDEVDSKTLDEIAAELFPDDLNRIRSRSRLRELSQKRRGLAEEALQRGHTLASIAEWMGRTQSALHQLLGRNNLNN